MAAETVWFQVGDSSFEVEVGSPTYDRLIADGHDHDGSGEESAEKPKRRSRKKAAKADTSEPQGSGEESAESADPDSE